MTKTGIRMPMQRIPEGTEGKTEKSTPFRTKEMLALKCLGSDINIRVLLTICILWWSQCGIVV